MYSQERRTLFRARGNGKIIVSSQKEKNKRKNKKPGPNQEREGIAAENTDFTLYRTQSAAGP